MSKRKTERLFNLTIALLTTRNYVTKHQLRTLIDGYDQLNEASFERQFERDKDELRAMGIPVTTGHNDLWFEDEPGYRIARAEFELPEVEFSAEELMVLGVAATVWQQQVASERIAGALTKLRAAGVEPDVDRLAMLAPQLSAKDAAFEPLWDAVVARRRVQFDYRGESRRVEPWQLRCRRGAWYLIGHDLDRDAARAFKLARFGSIPQPSGPANAFTPPDPEVIRDHARRLQPAEPTLVATVAIRPGQAPELRRRGRQVAVAADGDEIHQVPYGSDEELIAEVCAAGPDAVLLEPAELRSTVIARLEAMAS